MSSASAIMMHNNKASLAAQVILMIYLSLSITTLTAKASLATTTSAASFSTPIAGVLDASSSFLPHDQNVSFHSCPWHQNEEHTWRSRADNPSLPAPLS